MKPILRKLKKINSSKEKASQLKDTKQKEKATKSHIEKGTIYFWKYAQNNISKRNIFPMYHSLSLQMKTSFLFSQRRCFRKTLFGKFCFWRIEYDQKKKKTQKKAILWKQKQSNDTLKEIVLKWNTAVKICNK